jgi:hypothetical protein
LKLNTLPKCCDISDIWFQSLNLQLYFRFRVYTYSYKGRLQSKYKRLHTKTSASSAFHLLSQFSSYYPSHLHELLQNITSL